MLRNKTTVVVELNNIQSRNTHVLKDERLDSKN